LVGEASPGRQLTKGALELDLIQRHFESAKERPAVLPDKHAPKLES
jgi:hypothetical protein